MKIGLAAQADPAPTARGTMISLAGSPAVGRSGDGQARTVSVIEQPAGWTPVRQRWLSYAACGL